MRIFYLVVLGAHIIAVTLLISVMPRQVTDIWKEKNRRYRMICWVLFLGTFCMMLTNALPLLEPLFYGKPSQPFFNALVSLFNAIVAIILAVLGLAVQRLTRKSIPEVVDGIEKRK